MSGRQGVSPEYPTKSGNQMNKENLNLAESIIDAANVLANNEASTAAIAKSLDGVAAALEDIAYQMSRIANMAERNENA
jgi:hypothetical protein